MYDVIIIGGGPAGLTAAIYALRAGKSALVIEKNAFGGQITMSPKVENYPALESVSGVDFADKLVNQVLALGADTEFDEVIEINADGETKKVRTGSGEFEGKAIIIAAGAKPRMLGLEKESDLVGSGVSYCAVCDGAFYRGKTVAVNGGGNSALQDAMFLSDICAKVYLIHRRDTFRGEAKLVEHLRARSNVELVLNSRIVTLSGESELTGITVMTGDEHREISIDGLFVAIGHEPDNALFAKYISLDDAGYADSGEGCETKTAGVFVAGDCRKKEVHQLTTAVGDGATAGLAACHYIDNL